MRRSSTHRQAAACITLAVSVVTGGCSDLKPEDRLDAASDGSRSEGLDAGHDSATDANDSGPRDSSIEPPGSRDTSTESGLDADASVGPDHADVSVTPGGTDAPSTTGDTRSDEDSPEISADMERDATDGAFEGGNADSSCVPDCSELGLFRCGGPADAGVLRQLQVCSLVRGCLQWLDTATCRSDEACCEGACRNLEIAATCYAPPDFDYYVDAKRGTDDVDAGSSAGGTRQRPFRTVTRAVREATSVARPGRRIYVAAGEYDDAHGELFPVQLRGGVSIHGAGPNVVTLRGSGTFDRRAAGGVSNAIYQVTLIVGDDTAATTVSGVTILSQGGSQRPNYHGVFCDRGALPPTADTFGATILDNVVIGPGFHYGIAASSVDATDASPASGCKLRMYGSTVTGAMVGIYAAGCHSAENGFPISMQIGDMNRGNSFTWMGSPYNDGAGILVNSCVTQSSIRYNVFRDSTSGAVIDQRGEHVIGIRPFSVEHNTFTNLTNSGLQLLGSPITVVVNDNTFTNVSTLSAGSTPAPALYIEGEQGVLPLKKARRNTFIGNDLGMFAYSPDAVIYGGAQGSFDWGTPGDSGENRFVCNSRVGISTPYLGFDIAVRIPGPGVMPFVGNVWDHVPPTALMADLQTNGLDFLFEVAPPPVLDTSGGSADTAPCPPDRIRGPEPMDAGPADAAGSDG
jgi:hypothetical protein